MTNPYNAPAADLSHESASDETYEPKVWAINGRIGRLRYLAYGLLQGLVAMPLFAVLMGVLAMMGQKVMMVGMVICYIPLLAMSFILAKRRFNDMNRSGWLSLLQLVPLVGFFVALWLIFGAGDKESNEFGQPPCANSTGVVIGALVLPVIAIIGIVAAISLPAYQSYAQRARAAQTEVQNPASALPGTSQ